MFFEPDLLRVFVESFYKTESLNDTKNNSKRDFELKFIYYSAFLITRRFLEVIYQGNRMLSFKSLEDRSKRRTNNHRHRFLGALLGGVVICLADIGSAAAQKNGVYGLSPTEALNEQQLQNLKAAHSSGGCIGKSCDPQSLSGFLQKEQSCGCAAEGLTPPAQTGWALVAGGLIGRQIINWGKAAGWQVIWRVQQDWAVPGSVEFYGDFTTATTQVIEDLASEGASIHAVFYQGNRTLVITGGGQ